METDPLRVAVLAPINSSLYARLIVHRLMEVESVDLKAVVVRSPWNLNRLRSEFKRDGNRLLAKIYSKMLRGDRRFTKTGTESLRSLKNDWGLKAGSLSALAKEHLLSFEVVSDLNDKLALETLTRCEPDLLIFTGGGLLRKELLDIPRIGVMNCHMGILPHYRGMDVVEWPFVERKNPLSWLGVSLHLMDQGVDTGPILKVCKLSAQQDDTFKSIRERLEFMMPQEVVRVTQEISQGNYRLTKQAKADGQQYFVMHPNLKNIAARNLNIALKEKKTAAT